MAGLKIQLPQLAAGEAHDAPGMFFNGFRVTYASKSTRKGAIR